MEMINAYRVRGHLMADTDPLEYRQRRHHDLDVQTHGLTLWDLDREFATGSFAGGQGLMKMRKILGILRDSYCRTIGIEYMHISGARPAQVDPGPGRAAARVAAPRGAPADPGQAQRGRDLRDLPADQVRRAEAVLASRAASPPSPCWTRSASRPPTPGLEEVCIGMPHRGRLNVLANIVGKSYAQIFREFEGNIDPRTVQGSGDVKYHLGSEGQFTALSGDDDQDLGGRQPQPPRGGQPGAGGHRPGQAGHPRPGQRVPGAAGADARRRRLRRPGRGGGDAQPVASCAATGPAARSTSS